MLKIICVISIKLIINYASGKKLQCSGDYNSVTELVIGTNSLLRTFQVHQTRDYCFHNKVNEEFNVKIRQLAVVQKWYNNGICSALWMWIKQLQSFVSIWDLMYIPWSPLDLISRIQNFIVIVIPGNNTLICWWTIKWHKIFFTEYVCMSFCIHGNWVENVFVLNTYLHKDSNWKCVTQLKNNNSSVSFGIQWIVS